MITVRPHDVARLCHTINREWCLLTGDTSQLPWDEAPQWQRDSAIAGVGYALADPNATPESQHDAWCKAKFADGWTFGPEKDAHKKTHPCLVPYYLLPEEQRIKDALFLSIVSVFRAK